MPKPAASQPPLDGSLFDWGDIAADHDWCTLLIGNGLSINVWPRFDYRSLYGEATRLGDAVLASADRALFESLDTVNFERVLGYLGTSMRVQTALREDVAPLLRRYRSIQAALGAATRAVHVPWHRVPVRTLAAIQAELQRYEWVYTTNYDLLLYWAMGHDERYGPLVDCFWGPGGRFDPADSQVRARSTPVFFLHGAMHLIADASGHTRKLRRESTLALLDQFGQPIGGDPGARPLLMTEGSASDKRRAIESNEYLAHAYATLCSPQLDGPIIVFGSSLGEHDRHLTDALSVHPRRPVAVSMLPDSPRRLRARQADVYARLEAKPLLFFDATTHPLGAADLAASPAADRARAARRMHTRVHAARMRVGA
jgi:hypothetical protein